MLFMERYRDFEISVNDAWPYDQFAYQFVHVDYDGADDSRDSRYRHGPSVAACKAEIDLMIEEAASL
jgi:hypothetical protein